MPVSVNKRDQLRIQLESNIFHMLRLFTYIYSLQNVPRRTYRKANADDLETEIRDRKDGIKPCKPDPADNFDRLSKL